MELIFVIAKLFEIIIWAPVWWVASHLAAVFYPLEGEGNHDLLALTFSVLIIIALIFGGIALWG